ncbi:MAG: sigma-70 family RNA polymerase sigma factor, partial [Acidimicrobiales bacterium]
VSSFEDFYVSKHDTIARALALTLGDTQLGVEATDEAMTRAYQRWNQVRTYDNPSGWVYRVGLNWARSFLRKRRRGHNSPFELNNTETAVHDPAPRDPTLALSLASLDEKHRAVVVLRYLLDWSVEQTAEALEIAPGTVKSRLHRALNQLQAHMGSTEEA